MKTGIAGQLRCVVKKKDGGIVTDTGYQKNMILDTGLEFFGGGHGDDMFAHCVVGSGTVAPTGTDTQLTTFVSTHNTVESDDSGSEPFLSGDPEYRVWRSSTYRFDAISGQTVAEVGLASQYTSESDYYLCTKALIKNSLGEPIAITLKADEVLEITYRVWQVYDLADKDFVINITDDVGGQKSYNAKCRLAGVDDELAYYGSKVGKSLAADTEFSSVSYNEFFSYAGDIGEVTGVPTIGMGAATNITLSDYVDGSYTRDMTIFYGLDDAQYPVRSILAPTTMGNYQVQYGEAETDDPIPKSKNDTLTVPIRFTWARFEGELNATE